MIKLQIYLQWNKQHISISACKIQLYRPEQSSAFSSHQFIFHREKIHTFSGTLMDEKPNSTKYPIQWCALEFAHQNTLSRVPKFIFPMSHKVLLDDKRKFAINSYWGWLYGIKSSVSREYSPHSISWKMCPDKCDDSIIISEQYQ